MFDVTTSAGLLLLAGVAGVTLSVVVALLVLYVQRATSSPPLKVVSLVAIVLLLGGTPFVLGPLIQWVNPTSGVGRVFVHPSQLVLLGPSMLAAVVALTVWIKSRVHEPGN